MNYVWNFCNEHSMEVLKRERRFVSGFDHHACAVGLEPHSQTLQAIGEEYARRRSQLKKQRLRWRVSRGPRRSLGWVPFKAAAGHGLPVGGEDINFHFRGRADGWLPFRGNSSQT